MGFAVSWAANELISRHPTLAFQVAGTVPFYPGNSDSQLQLSSTAETQL